MRHVPTPAARMAISSLSLPILLSPVAVPMSTDMGKVKTSILGIRPSARSATASSEGSAEPRISTNLPACCASKTNVNNSRDRPRYGRIAVIMYLWMSLPPVVFMLPEYLFI